MDDKVTAVLDEYHGLIREQREQPSTGGEDVRRYGKAIRAKPGIASVLLPVGSGLEISRLETN